MKRLLCILTTIIICICLFGCTNNQNLSQIAATTLPVYEFTFRLCEGTGIEVTRLINEEVSCLHDYTLQTHQMRAIENAQIIVISGAGMEDFLDDALHQSQSIVDASAGISLKCADEAGNHNGQHEHNHENDPHIWLSPVNAIDMSMNIADGLIAAYPEHKKVIQNNLVQLIADIEALDCYACEQLQTLSSRKIVTFHDGFAYMAEAFDLEIVHAIEEESGSEASAAELIDLIEIVSENSINEVFTEKNGSTSAAEIIAAETGVQVYQLDMAMAGNSYFDAMYRNIDTLKEALK